MTTSGLLRPFVEYGPGMRALLREGRRFVAGETFGAPSRATDVHDGLHGDVFALSGGSFSGDVGTAFFARPGPGGGRRVDVEVRLLP